MRWCVSLSSGVVLFDANVFMHVSRKNKECSISSNGNSFKMYRSGVNLFSILKMGYFEVGQVLRDFGMYHFVGNTEWKISEGGNIFKGNTKVGYVGRDEVFLDDLYVMHIGTLVFLIGAYLLEMGG